VATNKILRTRFDHVSILIAPASGETGGSEHGKTGKPFSTMHRGFLSRKTIRNFERIVQFRVIADKRNIGKTNPDHAG
jgi:hypothetical protein